MNADSNSSRSAGRITPWLVATPYAFSFALFGTIVFLAASGCHRAQYRQRADAEAYSLVAEKSVDPHWSLDGYTIDVDPRSRMFDPFSPDREPMPIDDPTSHQLMHRADGKKGYPHWHANGENPFADNPDWLNHLPIDQNGVLQLNSDLAVQLALLHSPTYQQQLETLYLSALDVAAERFRYDTQFFGGYASTYTHDARARRGGAPGLVTGGDSRSNFNITTFTRQGGFPGSTNFGFQRMFTTGADFAAAFANSFLWQFSGPDSLEVAYTPLAFTFVQPLLRQAGRDVIMETLTLSERTLLANVRQMERYRRGFYVDVMTGGGAGQGPNRRGGVFGGSGLGGFTGVGTGFGQLGGGGGGGGGQGFGGGGAGAASAGGFVGLLQDQLSIRNQEDNLSRLRDNLLRLEETLNEMLTTIPETQEDIPRQRLQVAQARQALFNAESVLLNTKAQYQQTLDSFKTTLGLPPHVCVEINDPLLEPFNLLDEPIKQRRDEVDALRIRVGINNIAMLESAETVENPATGEQVRSLAWSDDLARRIQSLRDSLDGVDQIVRQLETENAPRAREDIERLRAALPDRVSEAARLREKLERNTGELCALLPTDNFDPAVLNVTQLEGLPGKLIEDADRIDSRFPSYVDNTGELRQAIDKLLGDNADAAAPADGTQLYAEVGAVILASQSVLTGLADDVLAYQLIQARARTETVSLVPIDLTDEQALMLASQYRRDWMNARASLVDRWRLIEFNADALESTLDVVFNGDISNVGDNPLDIRSSTGRLQVGFRFDAPFTRLLERNTYRQALIEFQQQRRSYYQFIDGVSSGLRANLRTIERNQFNFEVQRFAVRTAAEQIDLNEDIRKIRESNNQSSGPTAARDTVSALSDLLSAQNNFISVWVNYEVLRRRLDLDLGTMNLDERGIWIDPGPIGGKYGLPRPMADAMCAPDEFFPEEAEPIDPGYGDPFVDDEEGPTEPLLPPSPLRNGERPSETADDADSRDEPSALSPAPLPIDEMPLPPEGTPGDEFDPSLPPALDPPGFDVEPADEPAPLSSALHQPAAWKGESAEALPSPRRSVAQPAAVQRASATVPAKNRAESGNKGVASGKNSAASAKNAVESSKLVGESAAEAMPLRQPTSVKRSPAAKPRHPNPLRP